MVDLRIQMIRPAGKNNTDPVLFFQITQNPFSLLPGLLTDLFHSFYSHGNRFSYLPARYFVLRFKVFRQPVCNDRLIFKGHERILKPYASVSDFFYIIADIFSVRSYDRTVIVIAGARDLFSFIYDTGIKNMIDSLPDQPGHMAVGQFCRITFGFAWYGLDTQFINISVGARR